MLPASWSPRTRTTYFLATVGTVLMAIWTLVDLFNPVKTYSLIDLILCLGFAVVLLIVHLGYEKLARYALVLNSNANVFVGVILFQPEAGGSFVFFALTCLPWLLFERTERFGFLLSSILPPVLFILVESPLRPILFPPPIFPPDPFYFWANAACAFIACYFSYSFFAQAQRKHSEERLRKIVESNLIGIAIGNVEGKIVQANDVLLSMLGYTREDLKAGRFNLVEFTPAQFRERTRRAFHEAMELGRSSIVEKEYIRKDGTRVPVLLALSRLDAETGECIGSFLDLSDRRDLATKASELEESRQIIHAWNEFAAIAAHELKTPISVLSFQYQIFTRLLKDPVLKQTGLLSSNFETIINHGKYSTHRLNQLVNQLLDFSLIRAGRLVLHRKRTDLRGCLEKLIQNLEESHVITPGLIQFNWRCEDLEGFIDPLRFEQVMTNLITNAAKYGEQKPVMIILEKGKFEDWACIRVLDQGAGIPLQDQMKIFRRFERTEEAKKAASGLGLGLYIVKNILEAHDGRITVRSTPLQGAEFIVEFPLRLAQPAELTV